MFFGIDYKKRILTKQKACAKNKMKIYSYRKYKDVYHVNLDIIKDCDKEIKPINNKDTLFMNNNIKCNLITIFKIPNTFWQFYIQSV